jgi:hypothetical protein
MTTQPPTITPFPTLLRERGAPCSSVGDCGQLGIFGSNLVCAKSGCQNCSVDSDCNGVNNPPGQCINNLCSCSSNSDCSCEGNDPYGCGYDKKGNCVCSESNKGLAALKITKSKPLNIFLILMIGLILILAWAVYITKFTNLPEEQAKKYVMYGSGVISVLTLISLLI